MIYHGTVRGGVIVLPPDAQLPEGMSVAVQPLREPPQPPPLASAKLAMRNGIPVFPRSQASFQPDLELVNRLRDEVP